MRSSSLQIFGFAEAEITASARHPNELKLKGTLVRLDEPSTKAPHGSDGHKIMVSSAVAKRRLNTLINMGLNYAPSLKEHAARRKVGVITKAWIEGKELKVEATIWKKDFPEAERDLKRNGLGMSMEISQVQVRDQDASVWELSDFVFTGATVLEKTSAAYFKTDAIAAAAAKQTKENHMADKKKKVVRRSGDDELVERCVTAATAAVSRVMKPFLRTQASLMERFDAMEAQADEVEAEADEDDDIDAADDDPEMDAKGKKKPAMDDEEDDDEDEDSDDIDSEIDKGDEEDLGPEEEAGDDEPGKMNRSAKNKGRKSASEDKVGKTVSTSRLRASLAREKTANQTIVAMKAELQKMRKSLRGLQTQVTAAADTQNRRSSVLSVELQSLLRKGGIEPGDLQAAGEKLTVEQIDAVLDAVGGLPNVKRIELKDGLRHAGLMEDGAVRR